MHDIKWIRQNPDAFDAALALRGLEPQAQTLLEKDEARRAQITRVQVLQAERNDAARQIGEQKKAGGDASAAMAKAASLKDEMQKLQESLDSRDELADTLATIPNLPAADVPKGVDESGNKEERRWGDQLIAERKALLGDSPKQHFDIGEALGQMDFEAAAKLSGARFVVLKNGLACMERALASFMLDMHTAEYGYEEIVPPFMVRDAALQGTGQLPKFAEDLFRAGQEHWLIPTAEVPLTNLVADSIVDPTKLPIRYTAYTPCFRAEAGSAGRDTRGMIRQHQFSKVELVSITTPEQSEAEHQRMTGIAEQVLQRLGLPYRVMLLCTGDMGFSARKTYDLEVWLPGQGTYREISSVSNCGDFQARRMKARYKPEGSKDTQFLHTLNGSALAIGRTLVAILENYQQPDGSVLIPDALRSYMGGMERLTA